MAISYPTSIDTFTNPSAGSPLDNPDHAGQHTDLNSAVIALEQKVGITGSADTNSLDYKINNVSTDPIRIPLSEASDGFVTGSLVHTTPAGYTDTMYLYGTGTGNTLFTANGVDTFDPNANNTVYSIALQSDGKILIGGEFTSVGGTARRRVARLHANGDLDTTFADPNVYGAIGGSGVLSLAIQSDGKIIIGGFLPSVGGVTRNRIARVHANGDLDTTFDPNVYGSGYSISVWSLALQSDGKIVIGGNFTSVGGTARNSVARVHANGDLDTTFNPNANSNVYSIAIQSDGKIVIGGQFTSVGGVTRNSVARVHANGDLDTTFNPNADYTVRAIALQSDGKILIGGEFYSVGGTPRYYVARLHANGDLDTTFDPSAAGTVFSIAEQSDGKILIGGIFSSVGGTTRNSVARVHANGDLDTFDPNANGTVFSIAEQSDGKILIGGIFSSVGGTTRNRIARVEPYIGSVYDPQSLVYVTPSANSMNILVSDYQIPSGHSMVSGLSGVLSGYVIREAN